MKLLLEYLKSGKFEVFEECLKELVTKAPQFEGDLELGRNLGTAVGELRGVLLDFWEAEGRRSLLGVFSAAEDFLSEEG